MQQEMASTLNPSSVEDNVDMINKSSDSRNKLLDSIMTAPTLVWTGAMPKCVSDSEARHHIPASYIQIEDLHAMAQASLIAQTQEIISKQLESEAEQCKTKVKAQSGKIFSTVVKPCTKVSSSSSCPKKLHDPSQSGVKSLQCPYKDCNRTFSWPAHLKYHQLTHTGEKNFTCDYDGCGKSFYTKQRLLVHTRTHTGDKPFVCSNPGCGKSFTTAQNLANHQRIHTGERPYACDYNGCTRRFAEVSSLRKHSLTHTGKKPFHCEICGKTFTQSGSRMVHWKRHQQNKSTSPSQEPANNQDSSNSEDINNQNINSQQTINNNQNDDNYSVNSSPKTVAESQILVLHSGADHISQYQDIPVSDSVVFSRSLSDGVVTVTTQSSHIDSSHIQLSQDLITSHVVNSGAHQTHNFTSQSKGVNFVSQHEAVKLISQHKGVNFVVLAQPQDVISLSSTLQQNSKQGDPTELLDHEEIAQSEFTFHSLTNAEEGKEILTEGDLVPQEVSEVIVGDCSETGDQGSEMNLTDGLMAHTQIQIGAGGLINHRDSETTGHIISQDESEIIVGDCITLGGEGDNEGRFMSETCVNSEIGVGDSEMSVRDSLISRGDREIRIGDSEMCVEDREIRIVDSEMCVGDREIGIGDSEMCVGDDGEMSVRVSIMSQGDRGIRIGDVSYRDSEMCVGNNSEISVTHSIMSPTESEVATRDALVSNTASETCFRESLISHRDSGMSQRDSESCFRDSGMSQRDSESCFRDSGMSQRNSESCFRDSGMSQRNSESCFRDSLISHRDGEICVRDGLMLQGVHEIPHRDSEISHGDGEISHGDGEISHRDSQMSHIDREMSNQDSEISHIDSAMIHRDGEMCGEDRILSQSVITGQQGLSEHGHMSTSTQPGKEMVMDPMMESDDEGELAIPSGYRVKDGHLA